MSNPHSKNPESLKHQNLKGQNLKNPAPTKALRIAIFTDVFLGIPGGIPSSIRAQKTALESLGHQVTIFCPGTQQDFENPLSKFGANRDPNIILVPTAKFLVNGAPFS
ncbi:hypothetical protein EUA79_00580, partial [TM7 phylum sp. oral taxon 351]